MFAAVSLECSVRQIHNAVLNANQKWIGVELLGPNHNGKGLQAAKDRRGVNFSLFVTKCRRV